MVGVLIELGDDLRHTAVECVVRKQQVFLVHSGECHERIGAVQPLLVEKLVLRTVAVNDHGAAAECGGYIIAALCVLFDYFYAVSAADKLIAQVFRYAACTEQHHVLCALLQYAHVAEQLLHILGRGYKAELISCTQHKASAWDVCGFVAQHGAHEKRCAAFCSQRRKLNSIERRAGLYAHFGHLKAASCKAL